MYQKCCRYCFFLLCIKYIFFWFYQSVEFKANVEYTEKKVLRQPWNALTLQLLLSARDNLTNKIVFSLLVYSPEARVINFFGNFASISRGFRQLKWTLWLFLRSKFRD